MTTQPSDSVLRGAPRHYQTQTLIETYFKTCRKDTKAVILEYGEPPMDLYVELNEGTTIDFEICMSSDHLENQGRHLLSNIGKVSKMVFVVPNTVIANALRRQLKRYPTVAHSKVEIKMLSEFLMQIREQLKIGGAYGN